MAKYHLTDAGAKLCQATKKACPLGGEHFDSLPEAEQAFARTQDNSLAGISKNTAKLPGTVVRTSVIPQAGGRYFGCHVGNDSLAPYTKAWQDEVGVEKATAMAALKASRDRGYIYHMTVVTPPEMKKAKAGLTPFPEKVDITYAGVGSASDGANEAWFVVCHAPAIQEWRTANGLEPKDLHVTLGFDPKDVHTEPKGDGALRIV